MDAVNAPVEVEAQIARNWREGGYAVRERAPTVRESPYLRFTFRWRSKNRV
jgi:hypothetical protein